MGGMAPSSSLALLLVVLASACCAIEVDVSAGGDVRGDAAAGDLGQRVAALTAQLEKLTADNAALQQHVKALEANSTGECLPPLRKPRYVSPSQASNKKLRDEIDELFIAEKERLVGVQRDVAHGCIFVPSFASCGCGATQLGRRWL